MNRKHNYALIGGVFTVRIIDILLTGYGLTLGLREAHPLGFTPLSIAWAMGSCFLLLILNYKLKKEDLIIVSIGSLVTLGVGFVVITLNIHTLITYMEILKKW